MEAIYYIFTLASLITANVIAYLKLHSIHSLYWFYRNMGEKHLARSVLISFKTFWWLFWFMASIEAIVLFILQTTRYLHSL